MKDFFAIVLSRVKKEMPRLQTLRLWRPDDFRCTASMYILYE
jgi:hypothetical protein